MSKKQKDDFFVAVIGIIASASIIAVIFAFTSSLIVASPFILVGFGCWAFYRWKTNTPVALEKKSKEHTHHLYQEALARQSSADNVEFGKRIYKALPKLPEELDDLHF